VVTALSPRIGYHRAAELAREALEKNMTVRELVVKKKIFSEEEIDGLLDLRSMTVPPDGK